MKTKRSIILFFLCASMSIFAQKNIFKGGLVASGGVNWGLQYERSVSSHVSIIGQFGYAKILDTFNLESSTGFGVYVEGRYYFSKGKDLLKGWHGGIYGTYMNTHYDDVWLDYDQNNLGIGAAGGYQWIFSSHITIDTLIGGGYLGFDNDTVEGDNGFYPLIGLNLGYNF